MAGTPETYQDAHEYADLDATTMSLHHTLGPGATQAARGNHDHSDTYATINHSHPPGTPAAHEHPLYLPIISTTTPTQNPDGTALKQGQFWIDSARQPVDIQIAKYFWDGYAMITATPANTPAPIAGWAKAVWTVPANGVVDLLMNGRFDTSQATAPAGSNMRAYIGWQINAGAVQFDSVAGWAEWYQPVAGRFISSMSATATFSVTKGQTIKFFPIAGASQPSPFEIGFPVIRLLYVPDGSYQQIIGAI